MIAVTMFSNQPWIERLGTTLLHFLWQGALIAAVYGVVRTRLAGANARYVAASLAMAAMALAPVATWTVLVPATDERAAASFRAPLSSASAPSVRDVPTVSVAVATEASSPVLAWVVAIWFSGAIVGWARLAGGWVIAERMRRQSVRAAPPEWQQRLEALQQRIAVSRPVRLLVSPLTRTPAVVGWWRPVVLVPMGALAGLPSEQVEALLLHELVHIRRHDYLVTIAQSVVEALLFYHPAVWWVSGHMRTERELCCDDTTVAITGDAAGYARALAEVASAQWTRFTPAMAATGGPLAYRVARLLGQSRPAPRAVSGAGIVASAVLLGATALAVFGQSAARPQFEAASIKPSTNMQFMAVRPQPGRFSANATVTLLIVNAYSVQNFQIVGLPSWADSERFEVEAKAEGNANREQILLMVQSLLEDRFRMRAHRESKEMPVYELVAARNGLKLPAIHDGACVEPPTDMPANSPGARMRPPEPGPAPLPPCGRVAVRLSPGGAQMQGGKVAMSELARSLSAIMGRTVVDRTGVKDPFDLKVEFLPDQATGSIPPPPPGSATAESGLPSITTALQEQLGLRLQSTRGPVDVLVIDHIERPSAN
jgi:uncharacterized protein (TIGR03435 family)